MQEYKDTVSSMRSGAQRPGSTGRAVRLERTQRLRSAEDGRRYGGHDYGGRWTLDGTLERTLERTLDVMDPHPRICPERKTLLMTRIGPRDDGGYAQESRDH